MGELGEPFDAEAHGDTTPGDEAASELVAVAHGGREEEGVPECLVGVALGEAGDYGFGLAGAGAADYEGGFGHVSLV